MSEQPCINRFMSGVHDIHSKTDFDRVCGFIGALPSSIDINSVEFISSIEDLYFFEFTNISADEVMQCVNTLLGEWPKDASQSIGLERNRLAYTIIKISAEYNAEMRRSKQFRNVVLSEVVKYFFAMDLETVSGIQTHDFKKESVAFICDLKRLHSLSNFQNVIDRIVASEIVVRNPSLNIREIYEFKDTRRRDFEASVRILATHFIQIIQNTSVVDRSLPTTGFDFIEEGVLNDVMQACNTTLEDAVSGVYLMFLRMDVQAAKARLLPRQ